MQLRQGQVRIDATSEGIHLFSMSKFRLEFPVRTIRQGVQSCLATREAHHFLTTSNVPRPPLSSQAVGEDRVA
jgi:hypothetical protein